MIRFVSTYPPIMCGVGSYVKYLTTYLPDSRVISFDLSGYRCYGEKREENAVYFIDLNRLEESARGISQFSDGLVWFQHSFGMWPENRKFVHLLRILREKKIASFHTVHSVSYTHLTLPTKA